MEKYVRYKEERRLVHYRNPKELVDCIVTTFYDKRCACAILTKPYKLEVGDDVIVKSTGHRSRIKEVKEFNEEFGYKFLQPCYVLEEPDPRGSPWYYRRNLH